jgi:hypothetical protein
MVFSSTEWVRRETELTAYSMTYYGPVISPQVVATGRELLREKPLKPQMEILCVLPQFRVINFFRSVAGMCCLRLQGKWNMVERDAKFRCSKTPAQTHILSYKTAEHRRLAHRLENLKRRQNVPPKRRNRHTALLKGSTKFSKNLGRNSKFYAPKDDFKHFHTGPHKR